MFNHVKVIHGANDDVFNLPDGTTVFKVRKNLADAFNIPRHAAAFVNGDRVSQVSPLHDDDTLEFIVPVGRKGTDSDEEFIYELERYFAPEAWDEDQTPLKQDLFLDSTTYQQPTLFELPPVGPDQFSASFLVSPSGSFAYQNRILLGGSRLRLYGVMNGRVQFDGDVVLPTLIDMTMDSRLGKPFPKRTLPEERAKWGAVWMSLTPSEMLTQRSGVQRADGTVLIGGLGLGWLLRKVCEKDSVDRVIVVERSQELLDWYGYDLCKRFPKVTDVICDDVYNQIGKHGDDTIHLLDIWLLFSDSSRDRRLLPFRRKLKKRVWAWGQM